jgi:hypothetical protein
MKTAARYDSTSDCGAKHKHLPSKSRIKYWKNTGNAVMLVILVSTELESRFSMHL